MSETIFKYELKLITARHSVSLCRYYSGFQPKEAGWKATKQNASMNESNK